MSNETDSRVRSAIEKGRPLIDALIADLEREATLIRERDLDPRNLADEPRVQGARSSALEAIDHLNGLAKSLDSLIRTYSGSIDKRVDIDKIKEQIAAAPAAGRSLIDDHNGHGTAERIKVAGEDTKAKISAEADKGKAKVEEAAAKGKEDAEAAAHKAKDTTKEMLATLGWVTAAGSVIYIVFMDERRRRQAKSVAKAAANGVAEIANSATGKKS